MFAFTLLFDTTSYAFKVMESHQANKKDASGTAKAVISCFQKLGVDFDMDQVGIFNVHWSISVFELIFLEFL